MRVKEVMNNGLKTTQPPIRKIVTSVGQGLNYFEKWVFLRIKQRKSLSLFPVSFGKVFQGCHLFALLVVQRIQIVIHNFIGRIYQRIAE